MKNTADWSGWDGPIFTLGAHASAAPPVAGLLLGTLLAAHSEQSFIGEHENTGNLHTFGDISC